MGIKFQKKNLLLISVGVVYLWFGVLKFFPHLSPAEALAKNTIEELTMGIIPLNIAIILLAIWETAIGIMLILTIYRRFAISIALLHMVLTFTPFIFFSDEIFTNGAFIPSLVGQYIIKNIIIISVLVSSYSDSKTPEVSPSSFAYKSLEPETEI
ncbi:doxx family protein [Christiangramia fulva]|uniref:doxx family protein n=1 Tax=Christiangramia fulva TaxID=2126553 RepID=UPI00187527C9|nr:doxx family protein [Christiangramia fulva]